MFAHSFDCATDMINIFSCYTSLEEFVENSHGTAMIIIAIDFVVWKEHMQWKSWRGASVEGRGGEITRYNTIATKGSPKGT